MSQETIAILISVAGLGIALFVGLGSMMAWFHRQLKAGIAEFKAEIAALRAEVKAEIAESRAESRADTVDIRRDLERMQGADSELSVRVARLEGPQQGFLRASH